MRSRYILKAAAGALSVVAPLVSAGNFAVFEFQTRASRNPDFDRSPYVYPPLTDSARPHARGKPGEVNQDAGDVRLDGVVIDGVAYDQSGLQLVSEVRIVKDDATDQSRGGHNLTAGHGIGADKDPWVNEGPATTTPGSAQLRAAQANFNLTSLVPVRENVGTVVYEISFARPTDTLLIWERGNSGDVLVEALSEGGSVVAATLLLDGSNDGGAAGHYRPTGIFVTTHVQPGFVGHGQELFSVGLTLGNATVSRFRFTAYQEAPGEGAVRYNGPDLKVVSVPAIVAP